MQLESACAGPRAAPRPRRPDPAPFASPVAREDSLLPEVLEVLGAEVLCALPTRTGPAPLVNVCPAAFAPLLLSAGRAAGVPDPPSESPVGAGASF